ncbi:MAG: Lrp/AsnC family transcriptional regulator [Saprospiraceae bacterium]|nr:Lrp/AsnC family transcriptional regulator [Saprospiraceae bacterium]
MQASDTTLDQLDWSILYHLQEDGRRSFTELAEELKVSVGTIRNRYHKLVEDNILHIVGWADPVKAGFNAYARVTIEVKPTELIRTVAEALAKVPEVTFLAITSGQYDLEINLLCKDNRQLLDVMHQKIHPIKGVYETNTTIYFEVLKWAAHNISQPRTQINEQGHSAKVQV